MRSQEPILKPLVETALISEIALQSKLAEMAGEELSNASTPLEFWSALQSILFASANVSKILWPGKKRKARGEYLRVLLGIEDKHMLSDRSIRNSFEHYDERIENWFDERETAVYRDLVLEACLTDPSMTSRVSHRSYDQYSFVLKFRDESLNIKELLTELATLRDKCRPFALVHD
jgi:hypothetical protein